MDTHLDDDESLFGGSPPASPCLPSLPAGRSPSPLGSLALPGVQNAVRLLSHNDQNVGTIALAGSPNVSELVSNPLASANRGSLNDFALPGSGSARGRGGGGGSRTPRGGAAQTSTLSAPASTSTLTSPSSSKRKGKSNTGSHTSAAAPNNRPLPPAIPMPDPTQPIPPNYLRTQSALLGLAGLVSGIDPSRLYNTPQPGDSSSHPIDVDGPARADAVTSRSPRPPVSSSTHISPLSHDLLSKLKDGRNVHLLKSVIRYIASQAKANPQGFSRPFQRRHPSKQSSPHSNSYSHSNSRSPPSISPPPPPKRRKLGKVPAGAADWDVPYPFPEGEGPKGYKENWHREHVKKLLKNVSDMVKDAAVLASQQQENDAQRVERVRMEHLSRLERASHPNANGQTSLAPQPSLPLQSLSPEHQERFGHLDEDELLKSLLEWRPQDQLTDVSNHPNQGMPSVEEWARMFGDALDIGIDPQPCTDSHTPSMDFDEMINQLTGTNVADLVAPHSSAGCSTPSTDFTGPATSSSDVPMLDSIPTQPQTSLPAFPPQPYLSHYATTYEGAHIGEGMEEDTSMSMAFPPPDNTVNHNIDPFLLALPAQSAPLPSSSSLSTTPSLIRSPATETFTSFATPDPETPTYFDGFDGFSEADIQQGVSAGGGDGLQQEPQDQQYPGSWKGKGKERLVIPDLGPLVASAGSPSVGSSSSTAGAPVFGRPLEGMDVGPSSIQESSGRTKAGGPRPSVRKNEILQRARERREQLAQEQRKVGAELKELTIQHAMLSRLAQGLSWTGDGGA